MAFLVSSLVFPVKTIRLVGFFLLSPLNKLKNLETDPNTIKPISLPEWVVLGGFWVVFGGWVVGGGASLFSGLGQAKT